MKLKKILAGLVAGTIATSMAIQSASAEKIVEFSLTEDVYSGTITLSGTFTTSLPIHAGDVFMLGEGIPSNGAGPYSTLTAAEAATNAWGDDNGTIAGFKKQSSAVGKFIFGYSYERQINPEVKSDGAYIGSKKVSVNEFGEITDTPLVGANIGGATAAVSALPNRAPGVVPSIDLSDPGATNNPGDILWVAGPVDALGFGGIAAQPNNTSKTLQFNFTFQLPTGDKDSIAAALFNATPDEKKELLANNTFPMIWYSNTVAKDDGTVGTGDGFHNKFAIAGTPAYNIPGTTTYTAFTSTDLWPSDADIAAILGDTYTTANDTVARTTPVKVTWNGLDLYFTNAANAAGTPAVYTYVTSTNLPAGATFTKGAAIGAANAILLTNAGFKKATTEGGSTVPAVPAGYGTSYVFLVTSNKLDTTNLKKDTIVTKTNKNLIEDLTVSQFKKIEEAAKAGQSLFITAELKKAVECDEGIVVLGRENFIGKDPRTLKFDVKKGDTEVVLEIAAADLLTTYGTFNMQWLWWAPNSTPANAAYFTQDGSYQWDNDSNSQQGSIAPTDPAGGTAGKKNLKKIEVAKFTLATGAPEGGTAPGYAKTKDGAIAAVKDYLAGKTGKDIAIGAVKAYISG